MVRIFANKEQLAEAAAAHSCEVLRHLLDQQDTVRLLAATGGSQIQFLQRLTAERQIDWKRVELFHLDEYVGIGPDHPASFARYIKERIVDPTGITRFHLLDGSRDPHQVAAEMGKEITAARIDLAFAGIGENGHLAFNEPPADFDAPDAYLVVELDEVSRQQQVREGWFASLEDVPRLAITISVPQLLRANEIICLASEARKANAVKVCLEEPVSPQAPASVLRLHPKASIFLDVDSAALLNRAAQESLSC